MISATLQGFSKTSMEAAFANAIAGVQNLGEAAKVTIIPVAFIEDDGSYIVRIHVDIYQEADLTDEERETRKNANYEAEEEKLKASFKEAEKEMAQDLNHDGAIEAMRDLDRMKELDADPHLEAAALMTRDGLDAQHEDVIDGSTLEVQKDEYQTPELTLSEGDVPEMSTEPAPEFEETYVATEEVKLKEEALERKKQMQRRSEELQEAVQESQPTPDSKVA